MKEFFIPYSGKNPAHVCINGHKLVILSDNRQPVEDGLGLLGADRVRCIKVTGGKTAQEKALGRLAEKVDGGIVLAPADVDLKDVIRNLEDELPWLH